MAQRPVAGQGSLSRFVALMGLCLLLAGCAATPHSDASWRATPLAGNWVTIQRGDTLGALARQAGVPLVRLLRFNPGIDPRGLAIGQRVLVPSARERAPSGGPYRYQVRPGDTYYSVAGRFGTTPGRIQAANRAIDPNALRVGQLIQVPLSGHTPVTTAATVAKARTAKPKPKPKPAPRSAPLPSSSPAKDWPWPLDDYRIVRQYGPDSRGSLQPMLLSTHRGNEATAVASGQVSFANSMRHLGKVVIIHHPGNIQSVYALCGTLKVKEGQQVTAGTPLCTVGFSPATERYDLLFDARRGGKPIDPRKVLR
ncbi:MAG: LysM peptidoglycan-binding domain-containing protein [Halomonas sp.]|nr:LysM peptidoglycan-binding domain-containing protein [Halomonas sp.]